MKIRALRHNVWYKALDHLERSIMNLATRLLDRVRSEVLGITLVKIVKKLVENLKSRYSTMIEEYGLKEAKRLSARAVKWGYEAARKWGRDIDFARYLTLINLKALGGGGWLD